MYKEESLQSRLLEEISPDINKRPSTHCEGAQWVCSYSPLWLKQSLRQTPIRPFSTSLPQDLLHNCLLLLISIETGLVISHRILHLCCHLFFICLQLQPDNWSLCSSTAVSPGSELFVDFSLSLLSEKPSGAHTTLKDFLTGCFVSWLAAQLSAVKIKMRGVTRILAC